MTRNGFWHSRLKLLLGTISLVLCTVVLERRSFKLHEEFQNRISSEKSSDDFFQDVDYALETLEYMQQLKEFKAYVRPVTEKEQQVSELYWFCHLKNVETISTQPWTEHDDFYIYSAYYDHRISSLFPYNHAIQILSMHFRNISNKTNIYCNIYSESQNAVVEAYAREIWQRGWDPRDHFYIPYIITCPIPNRLKDLSEYSVSLSVKPCQSKHLAVRVTKTARKDEAQLPYVAVCVKGMDFQEDISTQLIEWFESQFLFGVDKITIYTYSVSPNTTKVIEYYKKLGRVQQIPLTLPGNSPNIPHVRSGYIWRNRQQKRRHELIPYNDCLYRHINSHRYILIIDTDEIVVPLKHSNYKEMLKEIEKKNISQKISSLSVRNVFKFPSKQQNEGFDEYILKNNLRSKKTNEPGEYGKSFTRISHVTTVFNHFGLHRQTEDVIRTTYIPEEMAIKLHYKRKCPIESQHECQELQQNTVIDESLDRYASEISERVKLVRTTVQL